MVLIKKTDASGKVTYIETDKQGNVIATREEGKAWKRKPGIMGRTASGKKTFIPAIPGGISQKDISEVALIGKDPSKPEIVGETREGGRRTVITPLLVDVEYFEGGELVATGKGTGEQITKTVKTLGVSRPKRTKIIPFDVIESAKRESREGDILVGSRGQRLDLTLTEQKLLAQTLITSRDVKFSEFSERSLKLGLKVEKFGRDIGTYLTSETTTTEAGRLTKRGLKSFVSTPFSFLGAILKAPAGIEQTFQAPESAALAIAFVATRTGRAIKEDPRGFGADILGSYASIKTMEFLGSKISQVRARRITTKIDGKLGKGKPVILREGGLELEISQRSLKSGESLIDDILGRKPIKQPTPKPSVSFKPRDVPDEFLGIVDDVEFWKRGGIPSLESTKGNVFDPAFSVKHIFDKQTLTYKPVFTPNIRAKPIIELGIPIRTTKAAPSMIKSLFDFKISKSIISPQASSQVVVSGPSKLLLAPLQTRSTLLKLQVSKQISAPSLSGASVLMQQQKITSQVMEPQVTKQKQKLIMLQFLETETRLKLGTLQKFKIEQKLRSRTKTKTAFDYLFSPITQFAQIPMQRQTQKQKMDFDFKFPGGVISQPSRQTRRRRKLDFEMPSLDTFISKKTGPLRTKYKPSLIALSFDIRGKRPKKLFGFEVRPL